MDPFVTVGALALLGFALARGQGIAPAVGGPALPSPPIEEVVQNGAASGADFWLEEGMLFDKCDLPDARRGWTPTENACAARWHADRAELFRQQVWLPASRVPIKSLGADDFQLALRFLAGALDRSAVPLTYGQSKRINDFNDATGWVGPLSTVAGAIVDLFTFGLATRIITPIANAAANAGSDADSQVGATESTDAYLTRKQAEFAAATVTFRAFAKGQESHLAIDEGPATLGDGYVDIQAQKQTTTPRIVAGPSSDFGYEPMVFPDGTRLYFRAGLHAKGPNNTWLFGWVSRETGYTGDPLDKTARPERIARIARLFRTLDVMGAMMYPVKVATLTGGGRDAEGNINVADLDAVRYTVPQGLYAYRIGGAELWGCVLPAHPLDGASDLSTERARIAASTTYAPAVLAPNVAHVAAQLVPTSFAAPVVPAPSSGLSASQLHAAITRR